MQTKEHSREYKKDNVNRSTETGNMQRDKLQKNRLHSGYVSDIKIDKDSISIELYMDKKESYGYFQLNLNKGKEIQKFENHIGSKLYNINNIIGTKISVYQDKQRDDHYVLYSNNEINYIKNAKFFKLDKPNYNNNVKVKESGHLIYVLLFLCLMIPLLLTGIHILFVVTISGLFSLLTPSIVSDVINSYYNIGSKKLDIDNSS